MDIHMPWWFMTVWNWLPWWSFIIVALVIVAMFWQPIAAIWGLLPRPIKIALGFLVSIVVAVQYGRNKGRQAEREKDAAGNARIQQHKGEINERVEAMPDDVVDRKLRDNKWMRD